MKNDDQFVLTKEQRVAFKRLKLAHSDCLKLGIEFYNNYGNLGAVDARKFKRDFYNDRNAEGAILDEGNNRENEFSLECSEWCDDCHWFHPNTGSHRTS